MTDFDNHPSLYDLSREQIAAYLEEIDDLDGAQSLRQKGVGPQSLFGGGKKYLIGSHMYGYIGSNLGGSIVDVVPATGIQGDMALIGTRIKVSLDKFRVATYPGAGQHRILTEILGRNQAGEETEDLRFSTILHAKDNDSAGAFGLPIFTGLQVPYDGLSLEARTVNVSSSTDDVLIEALESGPFKEGLKLLAHVQPILPQLVTLAAGISTTILKRRKNAQVQRFIMGMDFSQSMTSAKLRLGSYVVVQAPDDGSWNWSDWKYDSQASALKNADGDIAPFNTIIFGVTKSEGDVSRSASRPAVQNAKT